MSDTADAESASAPTVAQVVEKYVALRDRKAELKAAYDASVEDIDAAMTRAENYLLAKLKEQGADSVKTPFGTPYIQPRTSASVADWELFLRFVQDKGEWNMLKRDVAKTVIAAWRAANNNDLPPGVNWREELTLNVRRS